MPARTHRKEVEPRTASQSGGDFTTRLVDGSPDCIKVLDLDGRLLSMNAGGMKLLEICNLKPFIGTSWMEFWQGADRDAAEGAVKTAREGGVGKFVGFFPTTQTHTPKWFDVVVSPIAGDSGRPEKLLASSRDITAYKRADRALRALAEGTASVTGDEFFRSLARGAAQALDARYAFAAETLSELESRSLAFWEGADFGAGFTYRFPGTPCQRVAAGHVCMTTSGLAAKFPEDVWLQQIGADSYIGVPMRNAAGRTIGHLAVLHTAPMEPTDEDVATLKIFAARGCAELERHQADERLRKAHTELRRTHVETEAVLNITRAIGHHLQRGVLFGALAECLQKAVPTECFGIVLLGEAGKLQAHILTQKDLKTEGAPATTLEANGSAAHWAMQHRQWYVAPNRQEAGQRFPATEAIMQREKMESICVLPLVAGERVRGALFFMSAAPDAYAGLQHAFLEQVASAVAVALDDCLVQEEMRRLHDELAARKIATLEEQKQQVAEQLEQKSKALDASEERFRDLFDEAPIAYVLEGLDSRFVRANRAAMRILGITPDQVEGTYGKNFAPNTPEAQRRMREAFDSIGRGTDTSGVVLELRRRDNGKQIWIQWWSRPDPESGLTRTMFVDITDRVRMEQEKARLEAQNNYLQEEIRSQHNFVEIVGNSPSLLQVLRQVDQVAPTDSTVLICGESGTGKELIARAIHDRSPRREHPLVKVNCGAISSGLVESELFGHVKGAFTGAIANREGRFSLADGGTIFLDEVGELPPETQVKLLRVLQEQEFEPIGSTRTEKVNVRVIAATNRDLDAMVREGKFRSDLFYRLNVVPVTMPALRERQKDIPLLTMFFLEKFARKLGKPVKHVVEETMARLCAYPWPGNIRELQNVIERAVVLSSGAVLAVEREALPGVSSPATSPQGWTPESAMIDAGSHPASPPAASTTAASSNGSLEEVERQHILAVLKQTNWRIEGAQGAARVLNLQPSTLRSRMQKLRIARPEA
jgi:PAS domain S-box-containing protein